jgi:hypothetical protein
MLYVYSYTVLLTSIYSYVVIVRTNIVMVVSTIQADNAYCAIDDRILFAAACCQQDDKDNMLHAAQPEQQLTAINRTIRQRHAVQPEHVLFH